MSARSRFFVFAATLSLVGAACGSTTVSESPGLATTTVPGASTTAPAQTGSTVFLAEEEVLIAATGTLVANGDALELCPPGQTSRCAGIEVLGTVDPSFVSAPDSFEDVQVVRIEGRYDGRSLHPTSPPQPVDIFDQDFATPCEDLQATGGRGNPAQSVVNQIVSYTQANADTFAAWWWDSASGVANVWFTGDASAHRAELERLVDPAPICVLGGADYTETHLRDLQQEFFEALSSGEIPLSVAGGSSGGLTNRVEVTVEAVDQPTLEDLGEQYGEGLVIFAFIELLESPLADLPSYVPVGPDELDLVTPDIRFGGGMDALGRFEVNYDPILECFYLNGPSERILPVWPFGYSAGNDPVAVYDEDGNLVTVPRDNIEAGGGFVDLDRVNEPNTCQATGVWIFNGDNIVRITL